MKLYDFHCKACGKDFEELVHELSEARCPGCGGGEVEKQLSAFRVGGKASAASFDGCASGGCCGGGACGVE